MNNEEKLKSRLQAFIAEADIIKEEKALWAEFIPGMEDDDVLLLVKIFEKNPEKSGFLTQNLENKIRAVASGDEETLIKISESEKAILTED